MGEEASEEFLEDMKENYKRKPIGGLLPVEDTPEIPSIAEEELSQEERELYAKAAGEVIQNRGLDSSNSSYKKILTWMQENKRTDYPTE